MKIVYMLLGFICLGLGSVGVVLPMLPTAPFLLAAAFFFAKSSKRLHDWFVSTNIYKNHLDSFVKERAMTWKTKFSILLLASIMLAFPLIFSDSILVKIIIVTLYVVKYYYFLFKIKTIPEYRTK